MLLAAYAAVGVAVAGIHARLLLRDRRQSRSTGGRSRSRWSSACRPRSCSRCRATGRARWSHARSRPSSRRSRAISRPRRTRRCGIGGIPDVEARVTRYAIEIPGGLSILAHGDPAAPVIGLNDIPRELWPPVAAVHLAVPGDGRDRHVAGSRSARCGPASCGGAAGCSTRARSCGRCSGRRALGFVALEAGWMVTELGRQPWIIQGVMRTADAVTPMPGLAGAVRAVHARSTSAWRPSSIALIRRTMLRDGAAVEDARDRARPCSCAARRWSARSRVYALLGGADYGGGVWDLLATGPTRRPAARHHRARDRPGVGSEPRLADRRVVILFTGFPRAFAAVSTYLHVPLLLVLVGIVLRGSAFVFRAYGPRGSAARAVLGPRLRGREHGDAVLPRRRSSARSRKASCRRDPADRSPPCSSGRGSRRSRSPSALFALALFGYLAAVYLTLEAATPERARGVPRARAGHRASWSACSRRPCSLLAGPDVRQA